MCWNIYSYLIHRMLIKFNFPTDKYLNLYQEMTLTKHYLDAVDGHFCSEYVFVRWVQTELSGLINCINVDVKKYPNVHFIN